MVNMTRQQRIALRKIHQRMQQTSTDAISYRALRRSVQPGPGCVMVQFAGMWLGIEPDGYTHS